MFKKTSYLITLIVVLIATSTSFAVGSLYARRPLTNGSMFPLWLKSYDATVTITDQMAVTHVDQTFKNETNMRLEGIFFFPLPENAIVTELILWINGKPVVGEVMDSDTAQSIYQNVVKKLIDPALLEYMGDNIFKLSVFPIEPNGHQMSERRIEITYAELLPYEGGHITYDFFMNTVNLSSKAVERASIDIGLTTQKDILSLVSPTHDPSSGIVINRISNKDYKITYGEENAHSEKDLTLLYELKNDDFAVNHLTYVPNTDSAMFFDSLGDDSYYLLWITPPDTISQSQVIKKNIVFVADISSSMAGVRMEQLRKSLNTMVDMLNPKDMFNIIAFNTGTNPFQADMVPAGSSAMIESAHVFINELGEVGMTNMEDAFKEALSNTWDDTCLNVIVFLTDGKPTWPVNTSEAVVLQTIDAHNYDSVAIYTFGIGEEAEESFLQQVAMENNGSSFMIMQDDSIELVLGNFMRKISYPLIKNIVIDYGGLDKYDIFPKALPNLFSGTQLTVIGRYRNTGSFNTTFSGKIGTKPISFTGRLTYPSNMPNHPFVARMWASAKIDFLLDEIEIYGKQPELVNGVKYLGKRYAILTPFTSFIVIEDPTIVLDKTKALARNVTMMQNFPNPFTTSTMIQFSVPKTQSAKKVELKVYDLRGKLVKTLMNEMSLGGNYQVKWDARDAFGRKVGTGLYVAVLKAGKSTRMITMRLVR